MRTTLLMLLSTLFFAGTAQAGPDQQSFFGIGPGFEVLSQNGSGVGFYIEGFGGYNFNSVLGAGLHAGFSSVGTVQIRTIDFGAFFQATEPESGLYGRIYLDAVNASVSGGGLQHGVNGNQTAFAPGIASGMLIPSVGSFHLVPEVAYRVGLFNSAVSLITATFSVMWDF